jgi:hypothetical protein
LRRNTRNTIPNGHPVQYFNVPSFRGHRHEYQKYRQISVKSAADRPDHRRASSLMAVVDGLTSAVSSKLYKASTDTTLYGLV